MYSENPLMGTTWIILVEVMADIISLVCEVLCTRCFVTVLPDQKGWWQCTSLMNDNIPVDISSSYSDTCSSIEIVCPSVFQIEEDVLQGESGYSPPEVDQWVSIWRVLM